MSTRSLPTYSGNLPTPLTSLVGRDDETSAVSALLLHEKVRLLTLTGPGGVGKTRFCLQVAGAVAASFPDGVWFVSLAPIADPRLVVPTIAQSLGLQEGGETAFAQRLTTYLSDKRLMVVLDNFEQVAAAAPFLAEILARCPGLTFMVTSRVSLRVAAEQEFPVPPLPLVADEGAVSLEAASASHAVRLFVERARAVRPDFSLTSENVAAISAVCRLLDGLPLAIELAAARIKVLPPAALLSRLERRLPLLTGGGLDLPRRLRTMRDAIAWSYDLLSPEEQQLFRQLSIFTGGFDLDAAEKVTYTMAIGAIDGLSSLIDKNLLRLGEGPNGEPRYQMLETIREFGQERLAEHGEDRTACHVHARHFLALAEQAVEPGEMQFGAALYWTSRLEADHANLRAALTYFREVGEHQFALRLATTLALLWFQTGRIREGIDRLQAALAVASHASPASRSKALSWLALLLWVAGESAQAVECCIESERLATAAGDQIGAALALYFRSLAAGWTIDASVDGISYAAQALALAEGREPLPWFVPFALGDMGQMLIFAGDRERGIALVEDALALHRSLGQDFGAGMKLMMLALNAQQSGDIALAIRRYREGLSLLWGVRHVMNVNLAMTGLAALAAERGQFAPAARLLGMVAAVQERTGAAVQSPWLPLQGRAQRSCRAALGAERFAVEAEEGRRLPLPEAVGETMAVADTLLDTRATVSSTSAESTHGLTAREAQVLRLMAAGRSNAEIADLLFMSPRTASTHASHIYAKLDVASRAEAIAWAHQHLSP